MSEIVEVAARNEALVATAVEHGDLHGLIGRMVLERALQGLEHGPAERIPLLRTVDHDIEASVGAGHPDHITLACLRRCQQPALMTDSRI